MSKTLSFQLELTGAFASALAPVNSGLGETNKKFHEAKEGAKLFEAEMGKLSGGGFKLNLDGLEHGKNLLTFDLVEAAHLAFEAVHKVGEAFFDLGKEILKAAGHLQDVDMAINLNVGPAQAKVIDELAESFKGTRYTPGMIKESFLPLLNMGVANRQILDSVATAAGDFSARTAGGSKEAYQAAVGIFTKIAAKEEVGPKMLMSLGLSASEIPVLNTKLKGKGMSREDLINTVINAMAAHQEGGVIGAGINASSHTLGGTLERLTALKDEVFEKLVNSPGVKAIQGVIDTFVDTMNGPIGDKLMGKVDAIFTTIAKALSPEAITGFLNGAIDGFTSVYNAVSKVYSVCEELWPSVKIGIELWGIATAATWLHAAGIQAMTIAYGIMMEGGIIASLTSAIGGLWKMLSANPLGIIIAGIAAWADVVYQIYKNWALIKDIKWDDINPFAHKTAADYGGPIVAALKDSAAGAHEAGLAIGEGLQSGTNESLEVNSPSRVFARIGDYSAQGFGEGFDKSMDMGTRFNDVMDGAGSGVGGGGGSATFGDIHVHVHGSGEDGESQGRAAGQAFRSEFRKTLAEIGYAVGGEG